MTEHACGGGCGCGNHPREQPSHPHSCGCGGQTKEQKAQQPHSCGCGCGGHQKASEPIAPADHCTTHGTPQAEACHVVFWPRRIHALGGAAFAVFLCLHLLVNATAWNDALFRGNIGFIRTAHEILPWLIGAAIFLPLFNQLVTGLYLLYKSGLGYKADACTRGTTPRRYFLQRISAVVLAAFVLAHLGFLHNWGFHAVPHDANAAALAGYDGARVLFGGHWWSIPLFCLGIAAAAYHIANGAISGARVWGMFSSPAANLAWRHACLAVGIALATAGLLALVVFASHVA